MRHGPFLAALPARVACLAGIWTCCQIAIADRYARQGGEQPLRAAIALRPNHFLYHWQLAQLGTPDSRQLLEKAIRLNPYNAGPMVDLAVAFEATGDAAAAERWLVEANRVDKTYFPRWSLANFYLRQGREPDFWHWARRSAEAGSEDMTSLFDLARRLEPDVGRLSVALVPDRGFAVHNFLDYLARRGIPAPVELCERAIRHAESNRIFRLSMAVEGQLAARRFDDARRTWDALVAARLVRSPGEVPMPDTGNALDWRLPAVEGAFSSAGGGGLEIHLSGQQPDSVALCERVLVLDPSSAYTIVQRTRIEEMSGGGLRWKVVLESGRQFHTDDLARAGSERIEFRTGPADRLARLMLVAEREAGSARARGTLVIESVKCVSAGGAMGL